MPGMTMSVSKTAGKPPLRTQAKAASGELQADIYVQGSTQRVLNVTLNGMAVGSIVCTERDFSYSFRLHSDCPGRVAITAVDAPGLTLYATIILTPYRVA